MALEEVSAQDGGGYSSLKTGLLTIPVPLHHGWYFGTCCAYVLIQIIGGSVLLSSKARQSYDMLDLRFTNLDLLHENAMSF